MNSAWVRKQKDLYRSKEAKKKAAEKKRKMQAEKVKMEKEKKIKMEKEKAQQKAKVAAMTEEEREAEQRKVRIYVCVWVFELIMNIFVCARILHE